MKIDTRDFGQIEINPDEIIVFQSPIYGFENLRKFVLLSDDSVDGPFCWLQSTEQAETCFVLVDPTVIEDTYQPEIPKDVKKLLHVETKDQLIFRAMTVIPKEFAESTMNLKSPILINPVKKYAAQVILEADYPLRAKLMEASSC